MSRELSLILFNTLIAIVLVGVVWTEWSDGDRHRTGQIAGR